MKINTPDYLKTLKPNIGLGARQMNIPDSIITESRYESKIEEVEELLKNFNKINQNENDIAKLNLKNIIKVLKNGGNMVDIITPTGFEIFNVPNFSKIDTEEIDWNAKNILNRESPKYYPFLSRSGFIAGRGILETIRIAPDLYLVSIGAFSEKRKNYFIVVTLDQLALITDYTVYRIKAENIKKVEDEKKEILERYKNSDPNDRAMSYARTGYYYNLLPESKAKYSEEQWQALSVEDKDKLEVPYSIRFLIDRIKVRNYKWKLDSDSMYTSFFQMYLMLINGKAYSPLRRKSPSEEVWDYWRAYREMMRFKVADIKVNRQVNSEIRDKAMETAFGMSNTNEELFDEYGVYVKRQNGSEISTEEMGHVEKGLSRHYKLMGDLQPVCAEVGLIVSHTGLKYVFASKYAGLFMKRGNRHSVSSSYKWGDKMFECIMAHELGHFIDSRLGALTGNRYMTDNYESEAGVIAAMYRANMINRNKANQYANSTVECFARAMEQYYAIETFGYDAPLWYSYANTFENKQLYVNTDFYVNQEKYDELIKPLIEKFVKGTLANYLKTKATKRNQNNIFADQRQKAQAQAQRLRLLKLAI